MSVLENNSFLDCFSYLVDIKIYSSFLPFKRGIICEVSYQALGEL